MKLKAYTVYDSKAEAYLPPFFVQSRGLAIRSFTDAANSADHNFSRYASDFTLFELGEWDDSNSVFTPHPAPVSLGTAIEFIKRPHAAEAQNVLDLREQFEAGKRLPG